MAGALDLRLGDDDRTLTKPAKKRPAAKKAAKPARSQKSDAAAPKTRSKSKSTARGRKPARSARGRKRGLLPFLARASGRIAYWGAVAGVWAGIVFAGMLGFYAAYLPPASEWEVPKRPPNVQIVSAAGALIGNRGETGGEAIRLEQVPPYLPQAIIAIEDRRFYSHFGIDVIGLARAMVTNITAGRLVQGGSTLTQQLAKNLFLKPDRTIKRKMQEVVLALWLENNFSKDEIIELYLNRVYYGSGAYGIDAAARRYYNKSARTLTIAEAAVMAGVLQAPSIYSPKRNPDRAERRAQVVLMAMHREGFITEAEAANALASPAAISAARQTRGAEHYVADYALSEVKRLIGEIPGDLVVDTSIDMHLQEAAEDVIRSALAEDGEKRGVSQGALVAIDRSGGIKAMVGGRDYGKSQFNRAVSAKRQPGSTFKPFVYLTALEQGFTPSSIRLDAPVRINNWRPTAPNGKYYGKVSLTTALAKSMNTVAATTAHTVGPVNVVATAQRLGIRSKLRAHPSIALGTSEVTPLELTAAYVPFSNGGFGILPHVVRRIATKDGKVLYERDGSGPGAVIDPDHVGMMNHMLTEALKTGTGKRAALSDRPAAGKTGTTQDQRDAWFVGYTGHLTTGVWFGNDDGAPSRSASGSNMPAQSWRRFMEVAHKGLPPAALPGADMTRTAAVQPVAAPRRGGSAEESPVLPPEPGRMPGFLKRIFGGN
ncbi:MAG: PBP1A family penicillin-binding protein [Pseudomonadota bacterium]